MCMTRIPAAEWLACPGCGADDVAISQYLPQPTAEVRLVFQCGGCGATSRRVRVMLGDTSS